MPNARLSCQSHAFLEDKSIFFMFFSARHNKNTENRKAIFYTQAPKSRNSLFKLGIIQRSAFFTMPITAISNISNIQFTKYYNHLALCECVLCAVCCVQCTCALCIHLFGHLHSQSKFLHLYAASGQCKWTKWMAIKKSADFYITSINECMNE